VEQAGSTNADLLADSHAVEGDWLVAFHQVAGRGRQGRSWNSSAGNFYGSTLVELRTGDPAAQSLSLAAGLALIEAVEAAMPGQSMMLKWPNDVLRLGKKLAGILLERSGGRVVVGFGVNLASAPDLEDRRAASLDGSVGPKEFAPRLAESFERLLHLWRSSEPLLLSQAWLARAHPVGSRLTVHSGGGERLRGRFDGLEPDGALRLRRDDGALEIVRAADVEL
jgi:BirA family biotin operon repressor/biotin-[acetyl-CoA-carboxylase] ligase